jgi:hypothetical protein
LFTFLKVSDNSGYVSTIILANKPILIRPMTFIKLNLAHYQSFSANEILQIASGTKEFRK